MEGNEWAARLLPSLYFSVFQPTLSLSPLPFGWGFLRAQHTHTYISIISTISKKRERTASDLFILMCFVCVCVCGSFVFRLVWCYSFVRFPNVIHCLIPFYSFHFISFYFAFCHCSHLNSIHFMIHSASFASRLFQCYACAFKFYFRAIWVTAYTIRLNEMDECQRTQRRQCV